MFERKLANLILDKVRLRRTVVAGSYGEKYKAG